MINKKIKERLDNIRHTYHALREEFNDNITAKQVEEALKKGFELIEDYQDDPRGHSCLILTWVNDKPVHIACAPHEDVLVIITVYMPNDEEWIKYKKRK